MGVAGLAGFGKGAALRPPPGVRCEQAVRAGLPGRVAALAEGGLLPPTRLHRVPPEDSWAEKKRVRGDGGIGGLGWWPGLIVAIDR